MGELSGWHVVQVVEGRRCAMNERTVTCSDCGTTLDQQLGAGELCPTCGSARHTTAISVDAAVETDAAMSVRWEKHRRTIERDWRWLAALVLITIVGGVVTTFLVSGVWALLVTLAAAVLTFWGGLKGLTRVHEIERGGG